MRSKKTNVLKRIIDVLLTLLLLCLMAYQVTGEALHEYLGIGMTALVILHQALNAKWYGALFKGKYRALRIFQTAVNVLLLLSFAMTAFCGMAMSSHALPFLYGMAKLSFARQMHLSFSHWSFVLMGLHLGIHIPIMTAKLKLSNKKRIIIPAVFLPFAGAGLWLFLKNGMHNYILFRTPFAFLDFGKNPFLVFAENILILIFFAFIGMITASLLKHTVKNKTNNKDKTEEIK